MDLNKVNNKSKKNLSPAKKFRMKVRRAKFRKFLQAKEEYFEHDNRTIVKKPTQVNRKARQAQKYIADYKNKISNHENITENTLKSLVTIKLHPKQEQQQETNETSKISTNINVGKCCCHCACSTGQVVAVKSQRKPRVKLSSPYFGEISHNNNFTASNPDSLDADLLNGSSITEQTIVKSENNFNEFLQIREKTNLIKFQLTNLQKKLNFVDEIDERFVFLLKFYNINEFLIFSHLENPKSFHMKNVQMKLEEHLVFERNRSRKNRNRKKGKKK